MKDTRVYIGFNKTQMIEEISYEGLEKAFVENENEGYVFEAVLGQHKVNRWVPLCGTRVIVKVLFKKCR